MPEEEIPVTNAVEALWLLVGFIDDDKWQYTAQFAEAVAALNAACAAQAKRRPEPEPTDGEEACAYA